jgi:hypothetical protein
MSEPNLERLSQFTPNAGGLDRDQLLFAIGRASALPNRVWMSLAAALACTQVLGLALLGPRTIAPGGERTPGVAGTHAPRATGEVAAATASASPGLWSVRHELDDAETSDGPSGAVTLIDPGPPLRAFGPPPSSVLN